MIIQSLRVGRRFAALPEPRLNAWDRARKAISATISAEDVVIAWRRVKDYREATAAPQLQVAAQRELNWTIIAWLEGREAADAWLIDS